MFDSYDAIALSSTIGIIISIIIFKKKFLPVLSNYIETIVTQFNNLQQIISKKNSTLESKKNNYNNDLLLFKTQTLDKEKDLISKCDLDCADKENELKALHDRKILKKQLYENECLRNRIKANIINKIKLNISHSVSDKKKTMELINNKKINSKIRDILN